MDEFLRPNANMERIITEYIKHGSLVIAYDFDGTVHDYHKKGHTYEKVRDLIRDLKSIGCKCICWTAYKDHEYVREFCKKHLIPLDGINTDGIQLPWTTRKPFYNYILDDRSGLLQMYSELSLLVFLVRNKILNYESIAAFTN